MKVFSLLLLSLFFIGSGCTTSSSTSISAIESPPTSDDIQETIYTTDTSLWIEESLPGVTFFHPPELSYQTGGDIDTGSWSWLINKEGVNEFSFFTYALMKCEFDDPAKCNIGTNVEATVEEVYEIVLESLRSDESYTEVGNVTLGNTTGIRFDSNLKKTESDPRSIVLFMSSKGVFQFNDLRTDTTEKELYTNLLKMIVIQLKEDPLPTKQTNSVIQISSSIPSENDNFSFGNEIESSPLSLTGNILKINVGYSGGCTDHEFTLLWGGGFLESDPVQTGLYLVHDSKGDMCEAYVNETLEFDLTLLKQAYLKGYQASGGTIILHVNGSGDKEVSTTYEF